MDEETDPIYQFFTETELESPYALYTALSLPSPPSGATKQDIATHLTSISGSDIRSAYRRAALKCHPDKHASKSEPERKEMGKQFQKVGFAFAVLSDDTRRKRSVDVAFRSCVRRLICLFWLVGFLVMIRRDVLPNRVGPCLTTPLQWDRGKHTFPPCIRRSTERCWMKIRSDIKARSLSQDRHQTLLTHLYIFYRFRRGDFRFTWCIHRKPRISAAHHVTYTTQHVFG
jgi:hypothetical protein